MQRPTTNYFEKPMDLIFKSTKLIFVILRGFSLSPLQGISLLAETICLVQTDLWSWSLCQSPSWKWELSFQGMGKVPHWGMPNWNSHQGTSCPWGKSSCSAAALGLGIQWDRARLPPSAFTLAPHRALRTVLQPPEHLLRKRPSVRQKVFNVMHPKIGTTWWISITKPKCAVWANLGTFPFL